MSQLEEEISAKLAIVEKLINQYKQEEKKKDNKFTTKSGDSGQHYRRINNGEMGNKYVRWS